MVDNLSATTRPGSHEVTVDARSLRGLAHPLRIRMLGLLRQDGPATATLLAAQLGLNTAATSYHLRQLAAYGFVVEDAGRGIGRERWWRAAHQTTRYGAANLGNDNAEDTEAFLRALATLYADQVNRAVDEWLSLPEEWQQAEKLGDVQLRLTADELLKLRREIYEVIVRYRADEPDAILDAPSASRPVVIQLQAFCRPGGSASDPG
jgi:predicted ArsR family transcriptional regulator